MVFEEGRPAGWLAGWGRNHSKTQGHHWFGEDFSQTGSIAGAAVQKNNHALPGLPGRRLHIRASVFLAPKCFCAKTPSYKVLRVRIPHVRFIYKSNAFDDLGELPGSSRSSK